MIAFDNTSFYFKAGSSASLCEVKEVKLKVRIAVAGAALAAGLGLGLAPAQALDLKDLDPTKLLRVVTQARVDVHNYYPHAITVVMDSNREAHNIAPGGVATFTKPNKGDKPTFRAMKDGAVLNSKQVFLDGNKTVNFGP